MLLYFKKDAMLRRFAPCSNQCRSDMRIHGCVSANLRSIRPKINRDFFMVCFYNVVRHLRNPMTR